MSSLWFSFLLHDRPISFHSRRKTPSFETRGAKGSGPNSTPAQESSVPVEAMNGEEMSEPSSLYNTRGTVCEDQPYEAIREYVNLQ